MQAGKHVYVEKPVSHNIWEGRRLVEACPAYQQDLPGGHAKPQPAGHPRSDRVHPRRQARQDQRRPRPLLQTPRHHRQAPTAISRPPAPWITTSGAAPPPIGRHRTAQRHRPLRLALDLGVRQRRSRQPGHPPDGRRPLGPGQERTARTCVSVGGRFGYVDDGETANTQISVMDYGNTELIFEVRGLPTRRLSRLHRRQHLPLHRRLRGLHQLHRRRRLRQGESRNPPLPRRRRSLRQLHRRRPPGRRADLKGDIVEGHLSSALCHLANISYRLGPKRGVRPPRRRAGDRPRRRGNAHPHGRSPARQPGRAGSDDADRGQRLTVDARAENFGDDQAANRLLRREYRTASRSRPASDICAGGDVSAMQNAQIAASANASQSRFERCDFRPVYGPFPRSGIRPGLEAGSQGRQPTKKGRRFTGVLAAWL